MSEIKLKADLVQHKLTDLQNSLTDFRTGDPESGSGRDMLELQEKVNNVNESLTTLVEDYQQMAKQHVEASSDAVDSLEKTDQDVAGAMGNLQ